MINLGDTINTFIPGEGKIQVTVIDILASCDDRSLYLIVYANNKLHKFKQSTKDGCFDGEHYEYNELEYISTYQGLYSPDLH